MAVDKFDIENTYPHPAEKFGIEDPYVDPQFNLNSKSRYIEDGSMYIEKQQRLESGFKRNLVSSLSGKTIATIRTVNRSSFSPMLQFLDKDGNVLFAVPATRIYDGYHNRLQNDT